MVSRQQTADALVLVDEQQALEDTAAYERLAQLLAGRLALPVSVCFMGTPSRSARSRIEALIAAGHRTIVVLPLFGEQALQAGAELAGLLRWARTHWPDARVALAEPLHTRQHLIAQIVRRADETFEAAGPGISQAATALLVVGPGSSEPEQNAAWYAIARRVWEGRSYGWVEVAFSGQTSPDIGTTLTRCVRLGARQVIALPTCLNEDVMYSRLRDQAQQVAEHLCDTHVVIAGPLSSTVATVALIRQRYQAALQRLAEGDDGVPTSHGHTHGDASYRAESLPALLPPRYQDGGSVSTAPMGAAPLRYDAAGQVAWDQLWTDFCDLALAGGPPHRGDLLEPVTPAAVMADPARYAQVLAELERGLQLVTRLPIVQSMAPGWIGLACADEEMALWLLRAIVVENISVRREGQVLFLPAGPNFRVEHEIKNIITVMAKTVHYWTEHRAALR
jgi:sirohydrochlorin cobaltochelatase